MGVCSRRLSWALQDVYQYLCTLYTRCQWYCLQLWQSKTPLEIAQCSLGANYLFENQMYRILFIYSNMYLFMTGLLHAVKSFRISSIYINLNMKWLDGCFSICECLRAWNKRKLKGFKNKQTIDHAFLVFVIQILLRHTSTNHTLIFKNWFSFVVLLKKNMHPNCMLELGQGWDEGGWVGERNYNGFMLSDSRDYTAWNECCQPLLYYIISAFQRCSNASSVQLLSENAEDETSCFIATPFSDHKFTAFT